MKDAIKNNDVKTIYKHVGIDVEEDKEGYLTISEYRQPFKDYTFKDLGIDENKLFKKVKKIKGDGNFSDSQITDLGNLKTIGGNAYFSKSHITDLRNIESIGGSIDIRDSKLKQKDFAYIKSAQNNKR